MLQSGDVDAVYLAVPNSMHRDYAVAALNAGIHVLCEKPMARTEEECREMIEASARGGAKLMIAYRLHFEEATIEAIETVHSGRIGDPRFFSSVFAQQLSEEEREFAKTYQFGAETKYFSDCILENRDPEPDGEEGLADVQVLLAIEEALETGVPKPITARSERKVRPGRGQMIRLAPVTSVDLIGAAAPGGN